MSRFYGIPVLRSILVTSVTVAVLSAFARSQSATFAHPDGTTHWYQAVLVPGGVDWATAHTQAAAMGGHLATATSGAENTVIFGLIDRQDFWTTVGGEQLGAWIGGVQAVGSNEPAGGWGWGEWEGFAFPNWTATQPDNAGGADRLCYGGSARGRFATWADAPGATRLKGFVVEFAGPRAPRTVGLRRQDPGASPGYTLFSPWRSYDSYLIDTRGRVVQQWRSQFEAGMASYLAPNGDLIRAGQVRPRPLGTTGAGGLIERFDLLGNRTWSYVYASSTAVQHHDIELLPSGNILLVAWELRSRAEAIQAGRDPLRTPAAGIWSERVVEVQPLSQGGGTVVWEWRAFDHLIQDFDSGKQNFGIVGQHPERIDVNGMGSAGSDWLHINAIDYHPGLDQILLTVPGVGEIWIVDHSTTTAEAAGRTGGRSGRGGDLLYRWGNPANYRAGTRADRKLFFQHDAQWIEPGLPGAGHVLLFHNGVGATPPQSEVLELTLPRPDARGRYPRPQPAWGPAVPTWRFAPPGFFAAFMSGAQRLAGGGTLVSSGPDGRFFEVDPGGATTWEYVNPIDGRGALRQGDPPAETEVFRAVRYAPGDPAIASLPLIPGAPLETHAEVLLVSGSSLPHRLAVGNNADLEIRGGAARGRQGYQVLASLQPGLIPVDSRFASLGVDALLFLTLSNGLPGIFPNAVGLLDSTGSARAGIRLPPVPSLAGLDLHVAFVVIDGMAPSSLGLLSNAVRVRIVP